MRGLSRREFLGGTAGVVAAAALPSSGAAAALSSSGRARGAATPLAGCTINLGAYHTTSYLDAANTFDGYVGLPLATTIEKIYMTHGAFGSQPPAKMTQLAQAGCQFLVSIEPSRTMTSSEQNLLAKWLAMLNKAGMNYRVVLYSECNDRAFKTSADWLAYWSYYAPVVKNAGVVCGYDPGCGWQAITRAEQYFPANPAPDEMWMDYYATAYRGGSRLDRLIAIAQGAGVPTGLAEWGWAAGDTTFGPMTLPWWNAYCSYLKHLAGQGNLPLGAIFFSATANGRSDDVITSTSDPRIPQLKSVVQAIQAG